MYSGLIIHLDYCNASQHINATIACMGKLHVFCQYLYRHYQSKDRMRFAPYIYCYLLYLGQLLLLYAGMFKLL